MKKTILTLAAVLALNPMLAGAQMDLGAIGGDATSGLMDGLQEKYTEQCMSLATGIGEIDERIDALCKADPRSCKEVIESQGITEPKLVELCASYSDKAMNALSGSL